MHPLAAIRVLAVIGLLAAAAGTDREAGAQTSGDSAATSANPTRRSPDRPAATVGPVRENDLRIVGTHSLGGNQIGSVRLAQAAEPQPEAIAPGTPRSAPVPAGPPGSYERIDTGWKPIGSVSASITLPAGDLPANLAGPVFAQAGIVAAPINETHNWPTLSYSWEASAVPHNPLYFEDANLERYGYSYGILQPWISGGRFFLNVIFLPYKITAHPPREIQYPLGYYRPGDMAPPVREIEPLKPLPAVVEAAFVVGMIIILP